MTYDHENDAHHGLTKLGPVERGCGTRVQGGIYGVCPMGPGGAPLEHFLIDPPVTHVSLDGEKVPIVEAFGMKPRGTQLVNIGGTWHVLDWIGRQNYPNVADVLEEARKHGPCRRLSPRLDFELLGPRSRMIWAHARGHIENAHSYFLAEADEIRAGRFPGLVRRCPRSRADHRFDRSLDMCARLFWQDVEGGREVKGRHVERTVGSTTYRALCPPEGVEPVYEVALIASFPLARIEVVRHEDPRRHEEALEAARRSGVYVTLEDF